MHQATSGTRIDIMMLKPYLKKSYGDKTCPSLPRIVLVLRSVYYLVTPKKLVIYFVDHFILLGSVLGKHK